MTDIISRFAMTDIGNIAGATIIADSDLNAVTMTAALTVISGAIIIAVTIVIVAIVATVEPVAPLSVRLLADCWAMKWRAGATKPKARLSAVPAGAPPGRAIDRNC